MQISSVGAGVVEGWVGAFMAARWSASITVGKASVLYQGTTGGHKGPHPHHRPPAPLQNLRNGFILLGSKESELSDRVGDQADRKSRLFTTWEIYPILLVAGFLRLYQLNI